MGSWESIFEQMFSRGEIRYAWGLDRWYVSCSRSQQLFGNFHKLNNFAQNTTTSTINLQQNQQFVDLRPSPQRNPLKNVKIVAVIIILQIQENEIEVVFAHIVARLSYDVNLYQILCYNCWSVVCDVDKFVTTWMRDCRSELDVWWFSTNENFGVRAN